MTGPWDRDLDADLDALSRSNVATLVTLMEEDEMSGVGVSMGNLREAAKQRDIQWHWMPIRDVSIPDRAFEDAWRSLGPALRKQLRSGSRIVVHCRGGLGRSGTVAARLLVEMGMDHASAIKSVRAARPGAIETRQQEGYVRQCQQVDL